MEFSMLKFEAFVLKLACGKLTHVKSEYARVQQAEIEKISLKMLERNSFVEDFLNDINP